MPRLIALDGESLSNSFLMYAAPPDHEPAPREALRTFVERWVRLFRESPPSHAAFVTDGRAEEEPDPALAFVRAQARAVAEALGIPVVSSKDHPAAHVIFATA